MRSTFSFLSGLSFWVAVAAVFSLYAEAQIPQFLPDELPGEAAAEDAEKAHQILGAAVKESELKNGYQQARRLVAFRKGMKKPLSIHDYVGSYHHYKPPASPSATPGAGATGVGVIGQAEKAKYRMESRFGGGTSYGSGAGAGAVARNTGGRTVAAPARLPHPSGVVIREKNLPEFKYTEGAKVVETTAKGILVLDILGYNYVYVQPRRDYEVNPGEELPLLLKQDENRRKGPYKDRDDKDPVILELWQDYTLTEEEHLLALQKNLIDSSIPSVREKQNIIRQRKAELEMARKAQQSVNSVSGSVGTTRVPRSPAGVPGQPANGFRSGVQRRSGFGAGAEPGAEKKGFGSGSRFRK